MSIHFNRIKIIGIWAVIILSGLAMGYSGYKSAQATFQTGVINSAKRSAVAFGSSELTALSGQPADASTAAYATVKERLIRLGAVNPEVRRVFLIRIVKPGTAVYLADSNPADSEGIVKPGDPYEADLRAAGLAPLFAVGTPVYVGPFTANGVTWVTSYVVVTAEKGSPRVILGLDYTISPQSSPAVSAGVARAV